MALLAKYAALMTYNVRVHKDAVRLDAALLRPDHIWEFSERTCA
jgi:hypothetical protein